MMLKKLIISLNKKLAKESGETIVETMVSVLISSLALLLLATAIGASVRIVSQSKESIGTMYQEESSMVEQSETSNSATTGSYTSGVPIVSSDEGTALDIYQTVDGGVSLYKKKGD